MSEARALPHIETFADADALADAAAALVAGALLDGLAHRDRAVLVATGGRSPAPVYDRLAANPDLDWSRVDVTLSDERWVAPSSPDSNERLVREHLLVGHATAAGFTPLWSPAATKDQAALRADAALAKLVPFDVVLLGMGEDGHVASLFPGSPVLKAGMDRSSEQLCIGVPAGLPAPPQSRISLTLRALLSSRLIIILVSGEAKRRRLEAAMSGEDRPVSKILLQDRVPVRILWSA